MYPAMGSGKHSIIVKSLQTKESDKLFSAQFIAEPRFQGYPGGIYLIPKRGKNILDVLNGPRIGGIQVSPSGKYLIMAEGEIIKGKSSSITNVYRIADKEIVYTFYGNNVSNLTWIPGEDKLSYLIKRRNGKLPIYLRHRAKVRTLVPGRSDDQFFLVVTRPELSYLLQK